MRLKYWIQAFRPKTLTAAVVPVIATTALVWVAEIEIKWWISGMALLASLCIQIGTNLVNDVVDFRKGTDGHDRLGPQRVTHAKIFSEKQVWIAAAISFGLALVCGIPLVIHGGIPILVIGLLSIFFGYAYTGGPFPLAYWGLGDLFVIIFFGLVPVLGLGYLLTGEWMKEAIVLGLQIGFHCAILIAVNNLRDVESDRRAGRKTVPVVFGVNWAKFIIMLFIWIPYLLGIYWLSALEHWGALLPLLTLPLAMLLMWNIFATHPSSTYNKYLGQAALLHLSYGLLTAMGFIVCRL